VAPLRGFAHNLSRETIFIGDYPALDFSSQPNYRQVHESKSINGLRAGKGESRWSALSRACLPVLISIFLIGIVKPAESFSLTIPFTSEDAAPAMLPLRIGINNCHGEMYGPSMVILRHVPSLDRYSSPVFDTHCEFAKRPSYLPYFADCEGDISEVIMPLGSHWANCLALCWALNQKPTLNQDGRGIALIYKKKNYIIPNNAYISDDEMRPVCRIKFGASEADSPLSQSPLFTCGQPKGPSEISNDPCGNSRNCAVVSREEFEDFERNKWTYLIGCTFLCICIFVLITNAIVGGSRN
jgi:hypothetical protein